MFKYVTYYRPQTKFAKVMLSQVSVCPQGGSVSRVGISVQGEGGSVSGGSVTRGVSVQGGLCSGGGLCLFTLSDSKSMNNFVILSSITGSMLLLLVVRIGLESVDNDSDSDVVVGISSVRTMLNPKPL